MDEPFRGSGLRILKRNRFRLGPSPSDISRDTSGFFLVEESMKNDIVI